METYCLACLAMIMMSWLKMGVFAKLILVKQPQCVPSQMAYVLFSEDCFKQDASTPPGRLESNLGGRRWSDLTSPT
jgi:hypothetical protein